MNKVRVWCAALTVAACSVAAAAAQQSAILERIIVKVNGEILTQTQLEDLQIEELRNQNKQVENRKALSNEEVRKALIEITPTLLVDEVNNLLLLQRAKELNYKYSDELFKSNIENIKKQNNLDDEQRFQAALKQEGMSMADLRRQLERQMFVSEVQRRDIADKISVTDEESRAYYESHKQEFTTPTEVTLREIFIEVPVTDRGVKNSFSSPFGSTPNSSRRKRTNAITSEGTPFLIAHFAHASMS